MEGGRKNALDLEMILICFLFVIKAFVSGFWYYQNIKIKTNCFF